MDLIPHKIRAIILRTDKTGYFKKVTNKESYVNVDGKDVQSNFEPGDVFEFYWPRFSIGHKLKPTLLLVEGKDRALKINADESETKEANAITFSNEKYFIPPLTKKENAQMLKRLNALSRIGKFMSNPLAIALLVMVLINILLVVALLFGVKLSASTTPAPVSPTPTPGV